MLGQSLQHHCEISTLIVLIYTRGNGAQRSQKLVDAPQLGRVGLESGPRDSLILKSAFLTATAWDEVLGGNFALGTLTQQ